MKDDDGYSLCPVSCNRYQDKSLLNCSCGQPGDLVCRNKGDSLIRRSRETVTVDAEEWKELNNAINHARNYIAEDRQSGREWKGWTLDEFDSACKRIDLIRKKIKDKKDNNE